MAGAVAASAISSFYKLTELMNKQSTAELGLEPGGLRWHQKAGIRNIEKLLNGGCIHGECNGAVLSNTLFQFGKSADSSNEINAVIRSGICNLKNRPKQVIL